MRAVRDLVVTAAAALALTSPSVTRAQTPFHTGQWGADFTIGGFNGIGAVHFKAPDRAMTLNLFGGLNHTEGGGVNSTLSNATLQLGWRRYRPLSARIIGTRTFGVLGNWQHAAQRPTGGTLTVDNTQYGAGLFGNIGAQWMVTNDLSLGAQWGVTLQYTHVHDALANTSGHGIGFAFGGVGLIGALYF